MRGALLGLFKVFLAIVVAVSGISISITLLGGGSFLEIFRVSLFIGGLVMMIFSGLGGGYFGDVGPYKSPIDRMSLYATSRTYHRAITRERTQRPAEQFQFVILGVILGLAMMGLSVLLFQVAL